MWVALLLFLAVLAARHCYLRFVVRPGTLRSRTLPNGLNIVGCSGDLFEDFVYRENFVDRAYLRHGIQADANSLVVDVGANIGLFALSLLKQYPGIRVHCIEPVPVLFDACRQNTAQAGKSPGDVVCHNVALGEREGTASFRYNAQASGTSGLFEGKAVFIPRTLRLTTWLAAMLEDGVVGGVLPRAVGVLPPLLRAPVVGMVLAVALVPVWVVLGLFHLAGQVPVQRFETRLTTLDRIVKDNQIETVDLMKIDVEGAELMVLKSISREAFSRIRQIVIEVHDIDDRTRVITEMLKENGFDVTRDTERGLAVNNLFRLDTLYAVRR